MSPELRGAVDAVGAALTDVLSGASEAKIVVAGAANLARGALDFRDIAPSWTPSKSRLSSCVSFPRPTLAKTCT